jgi:alpha-L-rhamnosidase
MASIVGDEEAAQYHSALFDRISVAFRDAFVSPDGRTPGDTQTGYVLGLRFGLLEEAQRALAMGHLVRRIGECGGHLATGFIGVGELLPALTDAGHVELAYSLLLNETYPSWGYSIAHGATTIWERWDGWTEENGFQTPEMNSFNHYSLGSVGAWLFDTVGGIGLHPAAPGFSRSVIHPRPGGGLTWAKTSTITPYGRLACNWRIENNKVLLVDIEVPAGTVADLRLDGVVPGSVEERDARMEGVEARDPVGADRATSVTRLASGEYAFAARLA